MHVSHAEVAPLAPLLIPIGEILLWGVALGVCLGVVYFAKAFFGLAGGLLGKLPVVGGWIDSGLTSIEHKIVATMSAAAASCDAKIGAAFHTLARVVDWIGHEINAHANLIYTLTSLILGQNAAAGLRAFVNLLTHRLITAEANALHALRRANVADARSAHNHMDVVLPRIQTAERGLIGTIEHDIAGLRARERALEDGAINTWRWIKTHPLSLASSAFAGAVAIALQRIGGSWIRCNNWNRIGKQVCRSPLSDIEGVLGLFATAAVVADFRELVKLAQQVEHGVAVTLQDVAKL